MKRTFLFPQLSDRLFTALVLASIAVVMTLSGFLTRFDHIYYDLGQYLSFKKAPEHVVIVAIDEASLHAVGRWPWSRNLHADLITRLKAEEARVIGLDIIFSEPDKQHPETDATLASAIAKAGNVVLPILLEVSHIGGAIKEERPIPQLAHNAAALGSVHVPLDSDGIARSIYLWEGLSQDGYTAQAWSHFSQAILQVAHLLPANMVTQAPTLHVKNPIVLPEQGLVKQRIVSQAQRRIQFLGPPGHFQRISYAQVLSGDYPPHFFKDKIVLVGATAVGLGDALPTPVSAAAQPMPGVEYHANAIVAMQNQQLVKQASLWLTCVFCMLIALIPMLWLHRLTPLKSLLAIVLYFFAVLVLAVSMPHLIGLWLAPSGALVAIVLAYPVWSWRKLDSAQVFLDKELQNLRDELALLGVAEEQTAEDEDEDPFQARISKVKLAANHLRAMHQSRHDTVAFISHDIRAPLGNAIMMLNELESNQHTQRMQRMLGRAYKMAEGFLHASRAEMMHVNTFQTLEMLTIVQQAIDDVYEMAHAKSIHIKSHLPQESIRVRGDFGLLVRAVSNLLINAVHYAPNGSEITVTMTHDAQTLSLSVADAGVGISPEKLSKLFQRFSRLDAQNQTNEGSGLGLYFVDVTIKKHRGRISVQSQVGHGSTFTIQLPLERRQQQQPVAQERRQQEATL